ncbi:MAG: hypothetical protein JRJ10_08930 [Deltaproteobacteria bacterium]|nr:hypothetical protein [Deltaproteobacteria bacterium]
MSPRLRPSCRLPSRIAGLTAFLALVSLPAITGAQGSDPKGEPYRPGDVVAVPVADGESVDEPREGEDGEFRDPYGVASEARHADQISSQVRYVLEGIVVVGHRSQVHPVEAR